MLHYWKAPAEAVMQLTGIELGIAASVAAQTTAGWSIPAECEWRNSFLSSVVGQFP
jgi:hypothetical protein